MPITDGILFERTADFDFVTNVPYQLETGGSPSSFECGYSGSGPSEFSLNLVYWILEHYLVIEDKPENETVLESILGAESLSIWHEFKELIVSWIKIEPGDRYVLPLPLACRAIEMARENMQEKPLNLSFVFDEDQVQEALQEFRTRFLST